MAGKILTEIRQTKPFGSLEEEVFVSLQRTADALMQATAAALKPHGLSPNQYNVLRILRGAGGDGLPCKEIAARMITRDPDVTRLLDRLEARGLAARARERKDRRVITTRITVQGLDLLARLDRPVEELNRRQLGHLGEHKLRQLVGLLDLARTHSEEEQEQK